MCNRNCGDNRGGCARTIALMLLGVGLGKKFCDAPCGCFCVTPCPRPCKKPRPKPCCEQRQTVTDCYYARQYALYPCDTPCNRCGGFGEERFLNDDTRAAAFEFRRRNGRPT